MFADYALDINECLTSPCVELAKCKNTAGSFGCTCLFGYHGDGRITGTGCKDINECKCNFSNVSLLTAS